MSTKLTTARGNFVKKALRYIGGVNGRRQLPAEGLVSSASYCVNMANGRILGEGAIFVSCKYVHILIVTLLSMLIQLNVQGKNLLNFLFLPV